MPHEASRTYPRAGLTQSILAAAIRVHDALEPGLLEKPCRVCLAHALRWAGHRVTLEASLDILEDVQARSRGVHGATSDQARYGRGRTATHERACGSAGRPRPRSACAAGQRSWPGPGPVGRAPSPGSAVVTTSRGSASSACSALLQSVLCASGFWQHAPSGKPSIETLPGFTAMKRGDRALAVLALRPPFDPHEVAGRSPATSSACPQAEAGWSPSGHPGCPGRSPLPRRRSGGAACSWPGAAGPGG